MAYRLFTLLLILVLASLGGLLIYLRYWDFQDLRLFLDQKALDGKADFFTPQAHEHLRQAATLAGIALWGLALAMVFIFRRLCDLCTNLNQSFKELLNDFILSIREALREDKYYLSALGIILISGLVCRALFLNIPLKYDEATTFMEYSSKGLLVGLSYYSSPNNHLLHTALVFISTKVFGDLEWAIRLPAFFSGALIMLFGYLLSRKLLGRMAALAAVAGMAGSSILVEYGAAARGYGLMTLFFLCLLLLTLYMSNKKQPAAWTLFALFSAAGLASIPSFIYPLVTIIMWWFAYQIFLAGRPGMRTNFQVSALLLSLGLAGFLTLLAYVPAFLGSGLGSVLNNPYVATGSFSLLKAGRILFGIYSAIVRDWPVWLLALGVVGLAGLLLAPKKNAADLLLLLTSLAGVFLVWGLHGKLPPARTWIYWAPVFSLAAAGGMASLVRASHWPRAWSMACAIVALTSIGLIWQAGSPLHRPHDGTCNDAPQVAQYLKDHFQPDDAMLTICPADEPLSYYFARQGLPSSAIFLYGRFNTRPRAWVLVKDRDFPDLHKLLKDHQLDQKGFSPPRLIKTFNASKLYLVEGKE